MVECVFLTSKVLDLLWRCPDGWADLLPLARATTPSWQTELRDPSLWAVLSLELLVALCLAVAVLLYASRTLARVRFEAVKCLPRGGEYGGVTIDPLLRLRGHNRASMDYMARRTTPSPGYAFVSWAAALANMGLLYARHSPAGCRDDGCIDACGRVQTVGVSCLVGLLGAMAASPVAGLSGGALWYSTNFSARLIFLMWSVLTDRNDMLACWAGRSGHLLTYVAEYPIKSLVMVVLYEVVLPVSLPQTLAFAIAASGVATWSAFSLSGKLFTSGLMPWHLFRFGLVIGGLPVACGCMLTALLAYLLEARKLVRYLQSLSIHPNAHY